MAVKIDVYNGKFRATCSFFENSRIQALPKRAFKKAFGAWAIDATYDNAVCLLRDFDPEDELSEEARILANSLVATVAPPSITDELNPRFLEGMRPHQQQAIRLAWPHTSFGVLHRPRCGKTATTIRLASARYDSGKIDSVLIIVPTSVKAVWADQFGQWGMVPHEVYVFESGSEKKFKKWLAGAKGLRILVTGVEAWSSTGVQKVANEFIESSKKGVLAVVDESTRIKNHKATRTANIHDIGEKCQFRMILTGSELTRAPEDLFGQFRFLGVHTLGYDSFYAWRNRYCVMGGFEARKVVAMQNVEEFMSRISQFSHLVKTEDIVELPPKVFSVRMVEPTAEQKQSIKDIQKTMESETDSGTVTVTNAMTAMLRCQQIAGGFFPAIQEDGTTKAIPLRTNPKLAELAEVLTEEPGKVIVFARFLPEIMAIKDKLDSQYGVGSSVLFYGAVSEADRAEAVRKFQNDPEVRYFVANPTCASMGLELSAASLIVYYSQDFTYESRVQSLERATNLSKKTGVGVVDIIMNTKADKAILAANNTKMDMADYVASSIQNGGSASLFD